MVVSLGQKKQKILLLLAYAKNKTKQIPQTPKNQNNQKNPKTKGKKTKQLVKIATGLATMHSGKLLFKLMCYLG